MKIAPAFWEHPDWGDEPNLRSGGTAFWMRDPLMHGNQCPCPECVRATEYSAYANGLRNISAQGMLYSGVAAKLQQTAVMYYADGTTEIIPTFSVECNRVS